MCQSLQYSDGKQQMALVLWNKKYVVKLQENKIGSRKYMTKQTVKHARTPKLTCKKAIFLDLCIHCFREIGSLLFCSLFILDVGRHLITKRPHAL